MDKKLINDIKNGDVVVFKDGHSATVADNRKGLIREVEMKRLFEDGLDRQSSYAYEWRTVLQGGVWYEVTMTEKQQEQATKIAGFRSIFGI